MHTVLLTEQFSAWVEGLDCTVQARIAARLRRAELGNLGDRKDLGDGVSEMRLAFGPGYRMYYVQRGSIIIIMIGGGNKSTQKKDIARAKKLAATIGDEL